MNKGTLQIILVTIYSFMYLVTSMFVGNSVIMQTLFNMLIILIIFSILYNYLPNSPQYGWLKVVVVYFWIGQMGMYIVNGFIYWNKGIDIWLNNFNDYMVLIPVYIVSLLVAVIDIYKHD